MDWNRTFDEYVNMDHSLLYNIATNNADEIQYTLQVYFGYSRSVRLMTQIFAGFAILDKNVSQAEYDMFRRITDTLLDEYYSYNEFRDIAYEATNFDYIETIKPILRDNDDLRSAIIRLGLAVCAIDERLSVPEQQFIVWLNS